MTAPSFRIASDRCRRRHRHCHRRRRSRPVAVIAMTIAASSVVTMDPSYVSSLPSIVAAAALVASSSSLSSSSPPPPSPGGGPPSLPSSLDRLSSHANAYAAAHGLQVEAKKKTIEKKVDKGNNDNDWSKSSLLFQCAPMSLLPNAYPSYAFERAKSLAVPFNELVDRVSRDNVFLKRVLGGDVSDADPFTARLLRMYDDIYLSSSDDDGDGDDHGNIEATAKKGHFGRFARGADRLGIHRSDYMLNEAAAAGTTDEAQRETKATDGGSGSRQHHRRYELKQVELNTIAASFAGLAVNVGKLHRHLTDRFGDEIRDFLIGNARAVMGEDEERDASSAADDNDNNDNDDAKSSSSDNSAAYEGTKEEGKGKHKEENAAFVVSAPGDVPDNPALHCLPRAMNLAHQRYVNKYRGKKDGVDVDHVVLFVVQDGETNTVDQRMLEFALWEDHHVPVVRMSLAEANRNLILDEKDGALRISNDDESSSSSHSNAQLRTARAKEISLVYFRAGYAPTDYRGEEEWSGRIKIELGRCAKCPCLGYHLAGTKKVQQELAREGTLERIFVPTPSTRESDGVESEHGRIGMSNDKIESMRRAFAGLYSLGADATVQDLDAVRDALDGNERRYVLKPQREGGGYNFYGERLAEKLRSNVDLNDDGDSGTDDDGNGQKRSIGSVRKLDKGLAEYILMERLFPPRQTAILLRGGVVEGIGPSVSELGCFGTILADSKANVVHNEYAGWILRTKFENVDEGGVASGFATLSSPYLF